jgi:hypothetical protein
VYDQVESSAKHSAVDVIDLRSPKDGCIVGTKSLDHPSVKIDSVPRKPKSKVGKKRTTKILTEIG